MAGSGIMPIFVIQKHNAKRLHWDFRLSMNGVLKSWAVPKEPPKKSGEKRLAVQVEDHPLSYANFEGTIPKGMYGAGTVKIWDKGQYKLIEKTKDKLEFELKGKKLKGIYYLVRFKKAGPRNWLLFKKSPSKK
ncbi:MAG: 3'-phosphoesterase [Candidatus Woesearchaeota archaeon]|nr:3'-phosphoesterase [Candidatus Woesearchaeota archaeon]